MAAFFTGQSGAKVRLTMRTGTQIIGVLDTEPRNLFPSSGKVYYIPGVGRIDPHAIETIEVLEMPKPPDGYGDGTVLYAVNNGFHHVWVKSGGKWYTANRSGTVRWEAILQHCLNWKMPLYWIQSQSGPSGAQQPIYDPRRDVFVG